MKRDQLALADKALRRKGFRPRLWQKGKIWIDETYQGRRPFEVTHSENGSIRTDAAGLSAAIARVRRGPVDDTGSITP